MEIMKVDAMPISILEGFLQSLPKTSAITPLPEVDAILGFDSLFTRVVYHTKYDQHLFTILDIAIDMKLPKFLQVLKKAMKIKAYLQAQIDIYSDDYRRYGADTWFTLTLPALKSNPRIKGLPLGDVNHANCLIQHHDLEQPPHVQSAYRRDLQNGDVVIDFSIDYPGLSHTYLPLLDASIHLALTTAV